MESDRNRNMVSVLQARIFLLGECPLGEGGGKVVSALLVNF